MTMTPDKLKSMFNDLTPEEQSSLLPQGTLVPTVVEKTAQGERAFDIFSRLMRERIIFLNGEVNDAAASVLVAQIHLLEAENPNKTINFYINSPGGSVTAGMAIYDAMQFVKCPVATIGIGMNASMGSFLLAAGTKGHRYAMPETTILTHRPSGGFRGNANEMETHNEYMQNIRDRMKQYYAHFLEGVNAKDFEEIYRDDTFFNAVAGLKMGHVDHIVAPGRNIVSKLDVDKDGKVQFLLRPLDEEINANETDAQRHARACSVMTSDNLARLQLSLQVSVDHIAKSEKLTRLISNREANLEKKARAAAPAAAPSTPKLT
jgi:ATP-dependent Clp protease protease subunit